MASSYTSNYNLNQWEGSDQFLRTEFNEDNAKVDTALSGLAEQVEVKAAQADLDTLSAAVNGKASQADLTALTNTVSTKASQTDLDALTAVVDTKAAQTTVSALQTQVSAKANQSALNTLTSTVNTKASQTDLNALSAEVAKKGNCRFELGSYVGTGTGSTVLTFAARPMLVIITGKYSSVVPGLMDSGYSSPPSSSTISTARFSWSGSTLTMSYENTTLAGCLNAAESTYYYLAFYDAAG